MVILNGITSVEHEEIGLANARLRMAFKQGDFLAFAKACSTLFEGNEHKSNQLVSWVTDVGQRCKDQSSQMNDDQAMMRMWMLGNSDIMNMTNKAKPDFVLTMQGAQKIRETPNEDWFNVLLSGKVNVFL